MIGIDPKTGETVTGIAALTCRFERILTTQMTSRIKRRQIGNKVIARLGRMQSPTEAMIVQNLSLEALANPANGLIHFQAKQCQAISSDTGFSVRVKGVWRGNDIELQVRL
ncbi:phage baseplate protein [Photobacterium carnosum]|uniref:phage baseplate protein n=1 Tax=Photobacterium carnosum TaxID=2023717 RepID=UPI001E5082BE|nr:phage baseplate protein [Photobacterium carnosum]MCD9523725.1 phage baseplate protein [Photobacterium carnosum]